MRKLLVLIFIFIGVVANTQTLRQFEGTASIYFTSGSGPTYSIRAFYNDQLSYYSSDSAQVGDILYVLNGGACARLRVSVVRSKTGGILDIDVFDIDGAMLAPPSGVGGITRETNIKGLPMYMIGISQSLRTCVGSHLAIKSDTLDTSSAIIDSTVIRNDSIFLAVTPDEFYVGPATSSSVGVDSIQYVRDTTLLTPTKGDYFVNSTKDTSGVYSTDRWLLSISIGGSGSAAQVGAISPFGVVTPASKGVVYVDTILHKTYISTGLTSANWDEVKEQYIFDTKDDILDANIPAGQRILTKGFGEAGDGGGTVYYSSTDSITNILIDTIATIPLANGLYANIKPEGVLNPQMFGAIPNDLSDDAVGINKMFDYIANVEQQSLSSGATPANSNLQVNVLFNPGVYRLADTVFIHEVVEGWEQITIDGGGATIMPLSGFSPDWLFFIQKNKSDFSVADQFDATINFRNFKFRGLSATGSNGLFVGFVSYSLFEDLKFNLADTSFYWATGFGNTIQRVEITNPGDIGFLASHGNDLWSGTTACLTGWTTNTVQKVRVSGGIWKETTSHYKYIGPSSLDMSMCVSEGRKPRHNLEFDFSDNLCVGVNTVRELWLESVSTTFVDTNSMVFITSPDRNLNLIDIHAGDVITTDTFLVVDEQSDGGWISIEGFPSARFGTALIATSRDNSRIRNLSVDFKGDSPFDTLSNFRDYMDISFPSMTSNEFHISFAGKSITSAFDGQRMFAGRTESFGANALRIYGGLTFPAKSRVGVQKTFGSFNTSMVDHRPWGVYSGKEGFVTNGRFGFFAYGGNSQGLSTDSVYTDYTYTADTVGMDRMMWKVGASNDSLLILKENGVLKARLYGNSSNLTLSTLGKSKGTHPYPILADDGTFTNETGIPQEDIEGMTNPTGGTDELQPIVDSLWANRYVDSVVYIFNQNYTISPVSLTNNNLMSFTSRVNSSSTEDNTITIPAPIAGYANKRIVVYSDDLDNSSIDSYDTEISATTIYLGNNNIGTTYMLAGGETIELICLLRDGSYIWEILSRRFGQGTSTGFSNTSQTILTERGSVYRFQNGAGNHTADTLDVTDLEPGDKIKVQIYNVSATDGTKSLKLSSGTFTWASQSSLDSIYFDAGIQHLDMIWSGTLMNVYGNEVERSEYFNSYVDAGSPLVLSYTAASVVPQVITGTSRAASGFTFSSGIYTYTGTSGTVFSVGHGASTSFGENPVDIFGDIYVNGIKIVGTGIQRTIGTSGNMGSASREALLTLQNGDDIEVRYYPGVHTGDDDLTINQFHFTAVKVN